MTEQQIDRAIALKLAELKLGKVSQLELAPTDDHNDVIQPVTDIWGNAK